jgi:hypothetical protein
MRARDDQIPPPYRCGWHHPGHDVHHVQAEAAMSDHDAPMLECTLEEVRPDGVVVIELDGAPVELWNHHSARLGALAAAHGGEVRFHPGWGLLGVVVRDDEGDLVGVHQFCVVAAASPTRRDCPAPGERALDDAASGAFTISLGDLDR